MSDLTSDMTVCVFIYRTRWKCFFLFHKIFWNYFLGEPGTILWGKRDSSLRIAKRVVYGALIWDVKDVYSNLFLAIGITHQPSFSVVGRHSQKNSLNLHPELFYFIKIIECSLKQGYKLCFPKSPQCVLHLPPASGLQSFLVSLVWWMFYWWHKSQQSILLGCLLHTRHPGSSTYCETHWLSWPQATDFFCFISFSHFRFEK